MTLAPLPLPVPDALIFQTWARAWGIHDAAIADLQARYVTASHDGMEESDDPKNSETYVQSEIRLAAPRNGMLLYRNNVGALLDKRGVPVRYGLCNDNKKLNDAIKSADLIGIRKLLITQAMVGTTIGQFASVEVKKRGWKPGEDPAREGAQKQWATLVLSWGGYACITQSCDTIKFAN